MSNISEWFCKSHNKFLVNGLCPSCTKLGQTMRLRASQMRLKAIQLRLRENKRKWGATRVADPQE